MKWLVIALAVLAASIIALIVGPMIMGDTGYVLISLGSTAIEMSIISFAIIVICALLAWYIVYHFVLWAISLLTGSHRWFGALGERRRKRAFYQGLHALAAGDLEGARKLLSQTTKGDFDGVNYLASAQIAMHKGESQKAEYLLLQAADYDDAKVAATIMMARLDADNGDHEAALEKLNGLSEEQARHPQVIKLKAALFAELSDWTSLEENLSSWRKLLSKENYTKWSQRIAKGKFSEIASKQGAAELKTYWSNLPRKMRHDDAYRGAYIQQLLEQGMHTDAQSALVEWQKRGPNPVLFPLFNQLNLANAAPSIQLLESWIKQDEENPALYSTLGHVAHNSGDDVLAEKALLKATKLNANKEDLLLLAAISERKQDAMAALQYFKEGQQVAS